MLDKLKNIMKKSILCLASTVMILSGLTTNVFAATGTTGRKVYDNWILANPKDGSEHGHEGYLMVDDQPVFCVDYYTTFHKNVTVTAGTYKDIGITKEKAKRLSLIAYYGTKVSGRTGKDWYAITLVLCQYHINALYDCLNHIFYDWRIDASSKKCEPEALISIINHKNYPQNSIFTADRGYEDYNLLAYFIENSLKFAIRVKDIDTKNGMMTNIQTEGGAFDMNVTRTLTRLQTKEIKANKDKYVFVPTTSRFDFLGPTQDFYELSFRIVRFKITNDTYETIITNLSEDEFQLEDFKELYHYRREEETAFNKVKYTMRFVYFHAKNRKLIQQEINATFLMYNVSEVIINNIDIKQNRKYYYKANFSNAVTNIRLYLRNKLNEKVLISRIKKFLVPQRPERSFKRAIKSKSCKPLNYRTS